MSLRSNGSPRSLASRLAWLGAAPAAIVAGLLVATPASAASLTQVTAAWNGGNTEPSYITMYEYIPNTVATNPPILVVVHYCGGSASGIYGEAQGGGIISKADAEGFIMVFPQLNGRNCWDVATTPSLTHGGGGDTGAIVDMVKYEIKTRNANANRVYSIGSSSGAMMTEALLAVYPDVFKGGAEFAGVPAGCWSVQYASSNQWSGPCAGGQVTHTAQEWGDMVRAMYPGYNGFRPRIQLWHGTADSTINFANQTEAVKQWTNVLGLTGNGTASTVTISSHSYTRTQWMNSCGETVLDEWTEPSGPHGTDANMNGQYSLPFMNLDTTPFAATDPQAGCGTTSGTGGSGGTAGSTGTGTAGTTGSAGRGGTSGTAGTTGSAGSTGAAGRGTGTGGSTGSGGTGNTTGTAGSSASGSAGNSGTGGTTGTGTGTAGTTGSGTGVAGSGSGEAGTTGTSTGTAGSSSSGAAGDNTTGTAGDTGTTGTGGTVGQVSGPGCACNVSSPSSGVSLLVLGGVFVVAFGRRRARRSAKDR